MAQLTKRSGATAAEILRGVCEEVHLPGEAGYDAARTPWNVAVELRPAAVAVPRTTAGVAAVVRAATAAGLRIAPQGTGHNPGPLPDLGDAVLLRTHAMTGVTVDPVNGRVRVRAGTVWEDAVTAASARGTAVLHGSSPNVGVVGYSLGGGMGWYARKHGLAANSITGAELVIADGSVVRVDAVHEPDLFWALRGAGGNLGVVTELEFRTFSFSTAYAGMLVWDWKHADAVLPRFAEWAVQAPDEVTTSLRLMQIPPFPEIPEAIRGRQLLIIDGAVLAEDEAAARIVEPLRDLDPEIDTFARTATAGLMRLHMDPEEPSPAVSDSALLGELPDAAISALLEVAGRDSGTSLLCTELRQLGGAAGRPAPDAGALPCLDGRFGMFGLSMAATPEMTEVGCSDLRRLSAALRPWDTGRTYLNFVEKPVDMGTAFAPDAYQRLLRIRGAVDPTGRFLANHAVPAAAIPQQRR